ncbi:hypothetical protein P167DRAFT_545611 [Morchella conica CCBAS932]|uniref:Uncharacterized protein n=1 Tax=Morchella conica CCBAS932 TaxID=1392247 RepID=A0A3N4KSW0_9PEZI|nr:hypothetical protein P167DRAFT_545611 [Morchella conica CCBAS932]
MCLFEHMHVSELIPIQEGCREHVASSKEAHVSGQPTTQPIESTLPACIHRRKERNTCNLPSCCPTCGRDLRHSTQKEGRSFTTGGEHNARYIGRHLPIKQGKIEKEERMSADPEVAKKHTRATGWQTEDETSSTLQRIPNGKETFCFLSKSFAWEDAASPGLDICTVEDREHVPTTVLTNTCSSHNETPCHPKHFEFSACRFPLLSPTYLHPNPNPTSVPTEPHHDRARASFPPLWLPQSAARRWLAFTVVSLHLEMRHCGYCPFRYRSRSQKWEQKAAA